MRGGVARFSDSGLAIADLAIEIQWPIADLQSPFTMTDQLTRLTSALADRYSIQEELGAGGTWMNIE